MVAVLGLVLLPLTLCHGALGQSYSADWYKVAGGGGTSTNGNFSVSGTIGQPDASGALSGGNFSVTGGYWALVNVVQTPGAPTLNISHNGEVVTVYWQNVSGWNLIQSGNLTTPVAGWPASSGVVTGVTNSLSLTHPAGNLFFRLTHP